MVLFTSRPGGESHRDTAERNQHETAANPPRRKSTGHDGRDGETIRHQGTRIIDQTLALQDGYQATRHLEASEDGGSGRRVGGATIAPRTNAAGQVRSGMMACATAATVRIVKSTHPIARRPIGRMLARKSRHEVS